MAEPTEFIPFKKQFSVETRRREFDRISAQHSDRCPIICEPRDLRHDPVIDKVKFLVPRDLTVGQFMYMIRKRMKLNPDQALFLMTGPRKDVMLPNSMMIDAACEQYHDKEDGFMYITYTLENTFG